LSTPRGLKTTLSGWARLLRVPNLFTVPGDVMVGLFLATGGRPEWHVAGGALAVVFIYIGGLFLNDFFDRVEDARERPDRPIPSGAVDPKAVFVAGVAMFAVGVGIAAAVLGGPIVPAVAVGVAFAAFLYNAVFKKIRILGPLVMGSCRAGSVVLGAAFVGGISETPVLIAVGVTWLYTAAITGLAANETDETGEQKLGIDGLIPAAVLAAGGVLMCVSVRPVFPSAILAIGALVIGAGEAAWVGWRMMRRGRVTPPSIGTLVRVMLSAQAAWCIWRVPGQAFSLAVQLFILFALLRLLAGLSARRFYGS